MTLKPARLLLAMIAVAALPAFAQNVAIVNGKAIPTSRVDVLVKQVVAQGQQPDSPQLRETIKSSLVAREVLMQQALKLGFDKSPDVKKQLDNVREDLVINAMMREYAQKNPVTEAEIKEGYEFYKKSQGDKDFHVRHILVENEADAKAIIAKIKNGAKFDELAKASKDPGSADKGGDLDWAPAGSWPKFFTDVLTGMQKGAVAAEPVKSEHGFHVLKLDDTRPVTLVPYEELKPRIENELQQNKVRAFQEQMVKKAVIK
ncbi:MAG: peptidylprolyl isomerase [Pseudomonadota bacterium]